MTIGAYSSPRSSTQAADQEPSAPAVFSVQTDEPLTANTASLASAELREPDAKDSPLAARIAALLPNPIFILETTGVIRDANDPACSMLGIARDRLTGRPITELLDSVSQENFNLLLTNALAKPEKAQVGEVNLYGAAKNLHLTRCTLLYLDCKSPTLLVIVQPMQEMVDLTRELASLHEDLTNSYAHLANANRQLAQERTHLALLNQMGQRLSRGLDLDQVLQDALQSAAEMFGAQSGCLIVLDTHGEPERWAAIGADPAPTATLIAAALTEGPQAKALRQGSPLCVSDYEELYAGRPLLIPGRSLLVTPLPSNEGQIGLLILAHAAPGAFSPCRETALAAAAETITLAIQNARHHTWLRQAETTREHLTNLLVHDIRSPLVATQAGIEIVQRALIGQATHPFIQESLAASLRALNQVVELTNDLLEMKKLQSNRQPLVLQTITLKPLYSDVCRSMQMLAAQRRITLRWRVEPPGLQIAGDARLLHRMLVNLVVNALRFTSDWSTVTLFGNLAPNGEEAILVVEDMGPGVDHADRERIFQPFEQGVGEARRGIGLGLAFCRETAIAHGGRIWVEDRLGGGSRFCVAIPLERRPT